MQLELKLMGRVDAPSAVAASDVAKVCTYRQAVCIAWANRRVKGMTNTTLCELTGMRPSHVSDYLNWQEFDKKGRDLRDMPSKYIKAFESAVGNTLVSQWVAMEAGLTVLEGVMADQKAA